MHDIRDSESHCATTGVRPKMQYRLLEGTKLRPTICTLVPPVSATAEGWIENVSAVGR